MPSYEGRAIVEGLLDAAQSTPWYAEAEPDISGLRPDILLTRPDGTRVIVEIKRGSGTTHFSAVAQVESMASRIVQAVDEKPVVPVLMTEQAVPDTISNAARKVGVIILDAHGEPAKLLNDLSDEIGRLPKSDPTQDRS